jgi:hypothetical protein
MVIRGSEPVVVDTGLPLSVADGNTFGAVCSGIEQLGITTIASCHGPTIRGPQLAEAFKLTRTLPTVDVPPQPGRHLCSMRSWPPWPRKPRAPEQTAK